MCSWSGLLQAYRRAAAGKRRTPAVRERLAALRLCIHEASAQVMPTSCGSPWLGFVIDRDRRLLKARKARFATRHLGESYDAYCRGLLSFAKFDARVRGWIGHASHGDTWGLREHVLEGFVLKPGDVPGRPRR